MILVDLGAESAEDMLCKARDGELSRLRQSVSTATKGRASYNFNERQEGMKHSIDTCCPVCWISRLETRPTHLTLGEPFYGEDISCEFGRE